MPGYLRSSQMDGTPSQPRPGLPGYRQCCSTRPCVFRSFQERGQQQLAERTMGLLGHRMLRLCAGCCVLLRSVSLHPPSCTTLTNFNPASLKSQTPTSPPSPRRQNPPLATLTSRSDTNTHSSGALQRNSATSELRSLLLASSSTTSPRSSPPSPPPMARTSSLWLRHCSLSVVSSPV